MDSVAKRIRYLAACQKADNREAAIFDVFHKDVRHRYFPRGSEVLLTGLQDGVAIPLETIDSTTSSSRRPTAFRARSATSCS